nr:hypothetical protein [Micromonospora sp. DSM 115978]
MLGVDLDLEADLSIDSIKRVEVLGELADRLDLAGSSGAGGPGAGGSGADGLDESVVEELAAIRTIRGIASWVVARQAPAPAADPEPSPGSAARPALRRYVPTVTELPPLATPASSARTNSQ